MQNRWLLVLLLSLLMNAVLGSYLIKQIRPVTKPVSSAPVKSNVNNDKIFAQINPPAGYEINARFGNLGPKMIAMGVIDPDKFKSAYANSGQPLPADLEKVLTDGSDAKIKISSENSYFLLNFLWAVGLTNKSSILDSGEMMKYGGKSAVGNFASTGGWTLGKSEVMNYYSKGSLISLTPKQNDLVGKVAANIYRPCCNNSTAFPDCNHGMGLLGLLELMAANGASEDEMYKAALYFNAFWFPGNYYDLAMYFKNKENKDFADIDPKIILSKDFSSASGWQAAKKWLVDQGVVQQPQKSGGGCGV